MSCLIKETYNPDVFPSDVSEYLNQNISQYNASEQQQCMGVTGIGPGETLTVISNDVWILTWASNSCFNFLDNVPVNIQKEMMNYVFTRYLSLEDFVTNQYLVPAPQNNMMNVCSAYPGSCSTIETQMCKSCSPTQISSEYGLLRFCGCYAVSYNDANVTPQCASLCSNNIAIKLADSNGNQIECNEAICVIDNVSIQASDTIFNQSSISQVCNNCEASGGCKCFIDSSIPNLASTLGVEGNNNLFKTYCSDSQCFTITNNVSTEVSCNTFNSSLKTPIHISIPAYFLWALLIIFVLGIFVILSLYLWGQSFKVNYFKLWKPVKKTDKISSFDYRK